MGSFAIWAVGAPNLSTLSVYSYKNPENSEYLTGSEACQPKRSSAIRDGRKAERQRDACTKEADDYRLAKNDLIQQTRAANAAEAQANLAAQAVWLSFLQTIGGFLTLVAAAAAALYARVAATETRRSADIADRMAWDTAVAVQAAVEGNNASRRANEISEDTAKRQLRAYVGIDSAHIRFLKVGTDDANRRVEIEIKNFGQTPAVVESVIMTVTMRGDASVNPSRVAQKIAENLTVYPGHKVKVYTAFKLDIAAHDRLVLAKTLLVASGEIRWKDIYDSEVVMPFLYVTNGRDYTEQNIRDAPRQADNQSG